jgi:molybdenum cofactor cytidylyltransferase
MKNITAIVLAAGLSSRMKKFKLDLAFKSHTIIEEVLWQLSGTSIEETIVITGHYKERIENLLANNTSVKIIHNKDYALGMTTSIQCGVQEASKDTKGYLICLGDLPFISTEEYNQILLKIESVYNGDPIIVRPFFNETPANPVFFSSHFKEDLLNLEYMEGAKALISKNLEKLHKIILKTDNAIKDIDTPKEYNNYRKHQ